MGLSAPGSHHRRRSSALTNGARSFLPGEYGDGAHKREEQEPLTAEDPEVSDGSTGADTLLEMDPMSSDDDHHDDEETGLTAQERRQRRRRRRRQRRKLDARIADVKSTRGDILKLHLTDRNVVKKLCINASLILMWYFFSLSISIYNKWMFSDEEPVFPFPLFTTSLHMAVQFTFSALLLWLIPSLRPGNSAGSASNSPVDGAAAESQPIMTKLFYLTRLVPCGTATSLDVGLGNMSLKFISLTFLTMCKSSALAFVLLFAFVFGLETLSVRLVVIIAAMTVGVVMMVAGETAFNALGFTLVIASAFFSGFRWGLTQILLLRHPATSNPFSTLFFLTPVMFFSLIVIALSVEGPTEIAQGFNKLAEVHGSVAGICLLVFPGVLAFCMISSEFALLKRSSVVTLSICGIFKEVVTISAAGVVFHDKLTVINVSGLVITVGSIAAYNYMKISTMRSEAQRSAWDSSPNPDSDDTEDSEVVEGENGEYSRVADLETAELSDGEIRASSSGRPSRPFYVRTNSARHGLMVSTSPIPEDEDSPSGSAPHITSMNEAFSSHLHASNREASPGVHSASSVSPVRHVRHHNPT